MNGGALSTVCKVWNKKYSEDFIRYSLYKVALGLFKMHSKQVLHRDIKADNVLCSSTGEVKIADLGLSVFLCSEQSYRETRGGTANWVSPEIVEGTKYTSEVDVWAFGGLATELATGKPLFAEYTNKRDIFNAIVNEEPPAIPQRWSSDL